MPDRISIVLNDPVDQAKLEDVRSSIAEREGVEPEDVSNVDAAEAAIEAFLEIERLREDARLDQVAEAIAEDYGVDAADVSLAGVIREAAGAYCGFQRTDDWLPAEG